MTAQSLTQKTAVVTGSSSGIGLAVGEELARQGANVVINSFTNDEKDHALAKRMAAEHEVPVVYRQADMAQPKQCRALIESVLAEFGSVDILVNNAGIQHVAPVEEFPTDQWDAILAVNLSAAFHTSAVAVPVMRDRGWGRIINIASAHGLTASPFKSAYVAAKHGLVGLTKTVALETAESHITCNAICPGYVLTPLIEAQIPDQMRTHGMDRESVIRQVMLARQPTKEFITVEQVAGTVIYLCSDNAAQVTGTTLSLDGGWTAL